MIKFVVLFCVNISTVVIVNGSYVYVVVAANDSTFVLFIVVLFLSLFKIVWNFVLLRGSQQMESISDNTIVWLCLFNNLQAPLLAEMFVSPDCFFYIVSEAPSLVFNYFVYSCQFESTTSFSSDVCEIPVLFKQGYGIPQSVSVNPPFHYSYQCSFSLISSYAYVFILRYVLTGLIEPMLRILVYHLSHIQSMSFLRSVLPSFWRLIVELETSIDDKDRFLHYWNWWEVNVQSGMFRRRLVINFTTDMSILMGFGALFPPSAVVIAFSILKDVMSIKLALGRFCKIMEAVQDESLKEQMVKVKKNMDSEMLKAGAAIGNGVWHGIVMGTWVWGFVLFDTLASTEGVGKGLVVMIGMWLCPFILYYAIRIPFSWNEKSLCGNWYQQQHSNAQANRFDSHEVGDDGFWMHMKQVTENPLLK
jgi:hypothetical protein